MANTKFKTENGLLITGGDAEFSNQVFIGNTSSRANLTVDGELVLINGNLIVTGETQIVAGQSYTGDILAGINGLSLGNTTNRFNGYFANAYIYAGLYPNGNNISLGNSTNRWVITANSLNLSTTLSTTGAATFSNTLSATGAVTFSNTLNVTNTVTLSNTLNVTGPVTLSNTLSATGAVTFSNTINVTGFVNTGTRFDVSGGIDVDGSNGSALTTVILRVGNSTSNVTLGPASGLVISSTAAGAGARPISNTVGTTLGTSTQRWVLNANTGDFSGLLTATSGATFTGTVNASVAFNSGTIATTNGVSINTSSITIGNSSVNTIITGQGFQPTSNVNFDSGTFFVDFVNNRVGIGNTAPGVELRVTGAADISSTANIQGNANVGGTLGVAGVTTLAGAATLSSTLGVTGAITSSGGVRPSSNTVGATLGTTTQRWVLNANTGDFSGAVTFSNNVTVSGNLMVTSACTHYVSGNVSFGGLFIDSVNSRVGLGTTTPDTTLQVSGSANVIGATRLSNTLNVIGAATFSNTLSATGAATFSNTLSATGAATFSNTLSTTGAITFSNTLSTTGAVTFSNTLSTTGAVTFSNTLSVTNTVTFSNTLNVTGSVTLSNTLSATGAVTFSNTLSTTGAVTFSNTVIATGFVNTGTRFDVSGGADGVSNGASLQSTNLMIGNSSSAVYMGPSYGVIIGSSISSSGVFPLTNAIGISLGNNTQRWVLNANTGDFSGSIVINPIQTLTIGSISATTNGFSVANNLIRVGNTSVNVSISPSQVRTNQNDTVSAPGYSWTGDLNMGLYRPAADTIGFTTNGNERLRVNNSLISANLDIYVNTNTAIKIPVGNTVQRPAASAGLIRYNSEANQYEGSNSSSWGILGGGIGTTWNNVTANRIIGTIYTNSTGKPMVVSVHMRGSSTSSSGSASFFIDDVVLGSIALSESNGSSWNSLNNQIILIVPNGSTYKVTAVSSIIVNWFELT